MKCADSVHGGFTMVELVVVLSIMGILATLAAPSLTEMMARYRVKSYATDLYMALVKTRSEAIKRNASVTLSPDAEGWQAGWLITRTTGDQAVLDQQQIQSNVQVTGPVDVKYNSAGRATQAVTFSITTIMAGSSAEQCVAVSLSGMPTIKAGAC